MKARLLGLLLLAGCGSPTEPVHATLEFFGQLLFGIPTLETRAAPISGGIDVSGVFQTPNSGYTLFGSLQSRDDHQLVLHINAYNTKPGFPFASQNYYVGKIRNLPAGSYDLLVIHELHYESIVTTRAFHGTLDVP
jgi:hypothetical protein